MLAQLRWSVIALQQALRFLQHGERSLELALTGRLVPALEWQALQLTGDTLAERPDAGELLDVARETLVALIGETDARHHYALRMVANAMAIARRESAVAGRRRLSATWRSVSRTAMSATCRHNVRSTRRWSRQRARASQSAIRRCSSDGERHAMENAMFVTDLLQGRVAMVTGASRGLGLHFAQVLAQHGAHVVALARDEAALAALAMQMRAAKHPITTIGADVRDATSVNDAVRRAVDAAGRVDILVNNAGIALTRARERHDR